MEAKIAAQTCEREPDKSRRFLVSGLGTSHQGQQLCSLLTHTKPSSGQTQQSPLWWMWTLTATTVFSPLNISAPAQTLQCVWHWLLCLAALCVIFAPVQSIKTLQLFMGKKSAYELNSSMSQPTWALMAHLMQHYCVTAVIKVFSVCFFTSFNGPRTGQDDHMDGIQRNS